MLKIAVVAIYITIGGNYQRIAKRMEAESVAALKEDNPVLQQLF